MSELRINNITNSAGNGGTVVAGVSTVSTSAFMVMPSGDTAIRGAGSGRGIIAGGAESLSSPYTISDRMQYITISTTGNATDFGNLLSATSSLAGFGNETRGIWAGGYVPSASDKIDYVTIASTGNAADFGNCVANVATAAGCASQTHGQ